MQKLFAVHDVKAAAFGKAFPMASAGLALRGFVDACKTPECPFRAHPADYSLYELGEYDPNTGMVKSHRQPIVLMSASQALKLADKVEDTTKPRAERRRAAKAAVKSIIKQGDK